MRTEVTHNEWASMTIPQRLDIMINRAAKYHDKYGNSKEATTIGYMAKLQFSVLSCLEKEHPPF